MFAISHCVHVRCCNISAMTAFRSKSTFWPPFRFKLVGMLSFGNILVVIERFFIMLLSLRFFGFGNSSFVARDVTVVTETTIVELVDTVYCYFRFKQDYFDCLQSTIIHTANAWAAVVNACNADGSKLSRLVWSDNTWRLHCMSIERESSILLLHTPTRFLRWSGLFLMLTVTIR